MSWDLILEDLDELWEKAKAETRRRPMLRVGIDHPSQRRTGTPFVGILAVAAIGALVVLIVFWVIS